MSEEEEEEKEEDAEEEEEDEEKAVSRRGRPRRSSVGLRVAFPFPTKKAVKKSDKDSSFESTFSSSCLQDNNKAILGRNKSCRQGKGRNESASESEDEPRDEGQDALLRRSTNIKENKAMVRSTGDLPSGNSRLALSRKWAQAPGCPLYFLGLRSSSLGRVPRIISTLPGCLAAVLNGKQLG